MPALRPGQNNRVTPQLRTVGDKNRRSQGWSSSRLTAAMAQRCSSYGKKPMYLDAPQTGTRTASTLRPAPQVRGSNLRRSARISGHHGHHGHHGHQGDILAPAPSRPLPAATHPRSMKITIYGWSIRRARSTSTFLISAGPWCSKATSHPGHGCHCRIRGRFCHHRRGNPRAEPDHPGVVQLPIGGVSKILTTFQHISLKSRQDLWLSPVRVGWQDCCCQCDPIWAAPLAPQPQGGQPPDHRQWHMAHMDKRYGQTPLFPAATCHPGHWFRARTPAWAPGRPDCAGTGAT